jgi:hypothetical protein
MWVPPPAGAGEIGVSVSLLERLQALPGNPEATRSLVAFAAQNAVHHVWAR